MSHIGSCPGPAQTKSNDKMRMRIVEKAVVCGETNWRCIEVCLVAPEEDGTAVLAELVNAAQDIYQRYLPGFHEKGYQEELKTVAVRQSYKRKKP